MLTEVTCVVIACDGCGQPGFDSGDGGDWDGIFHFDTEQEAEETAREAGWFADRDRATCRRCLDKAECERMGHDWSEWRDTGPHEHRGGIYVGRYRRCWRCSGSAEYDPPLRNPSSEEAA